MRTLGPIAITFIPASKTRDDPKGINAYIAWKATLEDEDRKRQYGNVTVLHGRPDKLTAAIMTPFLDTMRDDILRLLDMTPEQVAKAEAEL